MLYSFLMHVCFRVSAAQMMVCLRCWFHAGLFYTHVKAFISLVFARKSTIKVHFNKYKNAI